MSRGKHRAPTRKGVAAARLAVGGLALAEITGGFAAIPAEAATPTAHHDNHHLPLGERGPDGLGQYRCDKAHLRFAACNPNNLGQIVQYPYYDGDSPSGRHAAGPKHAAKAAVAQIAAPAQPQPVYGLYVVRPGDTLTSIAASQQIPWEVLWSINSDCIPDPDRVYPGQQLRLPA